MSKKAPTHTFSIHAGYAQWRTEPGAYATAAEVEEEIGKRNPIRVTRDRRFDSEVKLEEAGRAFLADVLGVDEGEALELNVDLGPTWDLQYALKHAPTGREKFEVTIRPEFLFAVAKVAA